METLLFLYSISNLICFVQCHIWNEDSKNWETSGVETTNIEPTKRNNSNGDVGYFTSCNVTKMGYVAIFEGPPGKLH